MGAVNKHGVALCCIGATRYLTLRSAVERVMGLELKYQWRILTSDAAEAFMALQEALAEDVDEFGYPDVIS